MGYDIARKVRAMIAKAESTTHAEEADAIMQMVRGMLDRHGISLLSIPSADHDDPVRAQEAGHAWQSSAWILRVYRAAGAYYGVKVVESRQGNKVTFTIIGRESCRAIFCDMIDYLVSSVRRLAEEAHRKGRYHSNSSACGDIGRALAVRLSNLAREHAAAQRSPQAASGMNALVPVDLLDSVARATFPNMRTMKTAPIKTASTGRSLAAGINLNGQVTGQSLKSKILR